MAENEQVVDTGQNQAPIAEPVQAAPVSEAPAESIPSAPAEKMFTQSQMSAVAAKEARRAEERARNEARAEYEGKLAQAQASQGQSQNLGGVQQQTPEQIRQLIHQEAWNMSRQSQAQQIEQNWNSAMDTERMSDPEFGDLYEALNIEQHPSLVIAMAGMDNKAQMVKDLAQNPGKYANILMLANSGSPKLAQMELNKLSASIKANQEAQKQPQVAAPLSQIKPSNIGGDDGSMSVSDYRKMFRG